MAIQKLPTPTVRALGSSQTLTDPASLIKELLDNALDAHSTSITIDISVDTIDVVQVRDNGHGIPSEDRPAMAVRYSTSKIRDLHEMRQLGGRSLGFRGEALAATAQMAGKMIITTRVEGDTVAEACTIGRDGNIMSREAASHPVGTTVRVLNFLKNLPVRRENAVKNAGKTLGRVKRTLQAYAFARPEVRLSLKLLGAKSERGNWSYAPRKGGERKANFGLIVGRDVVGQCAWHSNRPAEEQLPDSQGTQDCAFFLEAFVAKSGADISKINGKGHFVSIDSRPVSCSRGTLKDITLLHKTYLRSAFPGCSIENPFIFLNIVCPPGSYDVNVEPAKDDVLFGDAAVVLTVVDDFFENIYGELVVQSMEAGSPSKLSGRKMSSFDVLLARRTPVSEKNMETNTPDTQEPITINSDEEEMLFSHEESRLRTNHRPVGTLPISPESTPQPHSVRPSEKLNVGLGISAVRDDLAVPDPAKRPSPWKHNMYLRDYDDQEAMQLGYNANDEDPLAELDRGDLEDPTKSVLASNPWTIARMNTPLQKRVTGGVRNNSNSPINQLPTLTRSFSHAASRSTNAFHLPSPDGSSSPPPSGPLHERGKQKNMISTKGTGKASTTSGRLDRWVQKADTRIQKSPSQDLLKEESPSQSKWIATPAFAGPQIATSQDLQNMSFPESEFANPLHQLRNCTSNDRTFETDSPFQPVAKRQKVQGGLHKPFVSLAHDDDRNWFQMKPLPPSGVTPASRAKTVRDVIAASAPLVFDSESDDSIEECSPMKPSRPAKPVHSDVAELLQFEARKTLATKQRRETRREEITLEETSGNKSLRPALSNNSPHRSRYQAAKQALQKCNAERPALAKEDPRAYLMDLMTPNDPTTGASMPPPRQLGRAKTMKLPLETTPEHLRVHNLELAVKTSIPLIEQLEKAVSSSDSYVAYGKVAQRALSGMEGIVEVQGRLKELIRGMYRLETGEGADVNIDLSILTEGS